MKKPKSPFKESIAIIGVAGRFPGAASIEQFWCNLVEGKESIRQFTHEELSTNLYENNEVVNRKDFISAKGYLEEADYFAADFFNISPKKAKLLDPQCRLLLECVWEAWENAGYDITNIDKKTIGVYATTSSLDSYLENNILKNSNYNDENLHYERLISNARDFVATYIAYQFNFKGPSLNIQTGCSSGLVAICKACDDLLNNQCDVGVVAGMSLSFPLKNGYLYKEGMIYSKDGHCRAFAEDATGIVPGNGGGAILLKRLKEAERDGDHIWGVIRGYAVNNDGHEKLSFTAPSVEGQFRVLAAAAEAANIEPDTISYIEAHGTGTPLGDQIEITALKKYFSQYAKKDAECYLGSVKTNIGHLDVAAGMAGFIKTLLALYHRQIPKSLHSENINPALELENTPFKIVDELKSWEVNEKHPRRAGVSSFGVGGTNAHVILEEYYAENSKNNEKTRWNILPLSAKSIEALEQHKDQLAMHIHSQLDKPLNNTAYTLQMGRAAFKHRCAVIFQKSEDAVDALYLPNSKYLIKSNDLIKSPKCVFLFSDQLPDSIEFIRVLYRDIKNIKNKIDELVKIIKQVSQYDIQKYFSAGQEDSSENSILTKGLILFVIEYSLAKYWEELGIKPAAAIGYGLGEVVSACYLGKITISCAIKEIIKRTKKGLKNKNVCISVMSSAQEIYSLINEEGVEVHSNNAPKNCAVIGQKSQLDLFKRKLIKKKIVFLEEATQLRNEFRTNDFFNSILNLLQDNCNIFLEIGFGSQLCRWIQQINLHLDSRHIEVLVGLPLNEGVPQETIARNLATAWVAGLKVNWKAWAISQTKHRPYKTCLPSYPFSRQQYLIEPKILQLSSSKIDADVAKIDSYLYLPTWKQIPDLDPDPAALVEINSIILLSDQSMFAKFLVKELRFLNPKLKFSEVQPIMALREINTSEGLQQRNIEWQSHLKRHNHKTVTILYTALSIVDPYSAFYDFTALAKAAALTPSINIKLIILTQNLTLPNHAMLLGPILCLPKELSNINASCIEVDLSDDWGNLKRILLEEIRSTHLHNILALKSGHRYIPHFASMQSFATQSSSIKLKKNGVYLISGGLGGIGLVFSEYLAEIYQANIVIISKSTLPNSQYWQEILETDAVEINLSQKLERLLFIQKNANQLLIYSADIADMLAMESIVAEVRNRFGKIDGVFHAASSIPEGLLANKNIQVIQNLLQTKIEGLNVLNNIFSNSDLDFMMLFSSLNAVLGEAGAADYVAANAYFDAYAKSKIATFPVLSINWDTWKSVGMRHKFLTTNNKNVAVYKLNATKWREFVLEHKLDQHKLLLGTIMLDICAQMILSELKQNYPINLNKIAFMNRAIIHHIDKFKLYRSFNPVTSEVEFHMQLDLHQPPLFRATLRGGDSIGFPPVNFIKQMEKFDNLEPLAADSDRSKLRRIQVGPHWDSLIWVKQSDSAFLAYISLPEVYRHEVVLHILHPSLFDVAYSFHAQFMDKLYLPFYIENIEIFSPLPVNFYSLIQIIKINDEIGTCECNATLIDETGKILVRVTGFTLKEVVGEVNPSKQPIDSSLTGLSNAEGIAILNEVLRGPNPQTIVSMRPIQEMREVIKITVESASDNSQGDISERIKQVWIKSLGLKNISYEDNFFDLNGDSLLAIDVCHQISKIINANVTPTILLENAVLRQFIEAVEAIKNTISEVA